ncbi:phosphatase PAP2 family protein [uncultured Kocuria sp.]|uniref:phosphatase PAP2 family protein n=1 Tax=uncultured Kocuria sp. TaxID=259305 RepID=UPI0025F9EA82|nr:phosphatase PAP2 family protein [uncultured Kocuria sp.]
MSYASFPPGPHASYPAPGAPAPGAPRRVRARSVVGTLVVLALLWGLVLVVAHAGLQTVTGQALDEVALAQAKADRNAYFPRPVLVLAQYAPEVVALLAGVLALVWAVRYRRWTAALCAAGAVIAANVTTQFLKHGVLDKPDLGIQQIASNSFPSGHTTAAASFLMALLLVAPPHRRARAGRWGAFLAAVVGMLTVVNGWHRPSDAAAAVLVVAGWGLVAALAERLIGFALARTGRARRGSAGAGLRRYREDRSRRRRRLSWREDRGDSAYVPPAHERQAEEREWAASSTGREDPRGGTRNSGEWNDAAQSHAASNGGGQRAASWDRQSPSREAEDGSPWFPARPRTATALILVVLTAVLLAAAVWWPYPTVAGTLAGRITVLAGYLGIAAAAALGWAAVAARLRSPIR